MDEALTEPVAEVSEAPEVVFIDISRCLHFDSCHAPVAGFEHQVDFALGQRPVESATGARRPTPITDQQPTRCQPCTTSGDASHERLNFPTMPALRDANRSSP